MGLRLYGTPDDALSIGDHALIGDCRSAALIATDGSLDWLCLPRFDSPSVFAALLDPQAGGSFQIRPTGPYRSERRYLPATNILETTFHTATGAVVLRDLMPVRSEDERRADLTPEHEVLREIEGVAGEVEVEIIYDPRPDYGRKHPVLRQRGALGLWCECGGAALVLRSDVSVRPAPGLPGARGQTVVRAGERKYASLLYTREAPAVLPPLGSGAHERIAHSARWWQEWADRCTYVGPWREAVLRSALTLKLLTYAPSGAIVAAPTTSLPEHVGGVRNWDYRLCWLRDASLVVHALLGLGYDEEGTAFLHWMIHTTRLTRPELGAVYDIFGGVNVEEKELPHLAGFRGSRPVRIGNGARDQFQLDVYGEVIAAAAEFVERGGRLDRETSNLLKGFGDVVRRRWSEPDDGIWETRAGRRQYTHSKLLCWVALDRLIWLSESGAVDVDEETLRIERDIIRRIIEAHGFSQRQGSYTQRFDEDDVDASLLVLPMHGYADGADPRMLATLDRVLGELADGSLVRRYAEGTDDGLPPGEGAFGLCSFWAVDFLARGGRVDEAVRTFEDLLSYANDVGLYGEEIDPTTGAALGNFPQAFTHVGLINAALTLAECSRTDQAAGRRRDPVGGGQVRA